MIRLLERCASRRAWFVVAAALLPVVIRLLLLPWFPPPVPRVADEFSHLLVADTLASGRLANPPHPLSRHLETIYVLQHPTYSSIYPIGQGAILAVGQIAGHPWTGVLLSVALMSAGITWMLFGCLPAGWAALGGLLAGLHFGLAPQWVSSYWGGALGAFGGALWFGALVRLRRSPSKAMGVVAGLGWSIVWLIRPFESLLPAVFVWATIAVLAFRGPRRWRPWVAPLALLAIVQSLAGATTAIHNRAVTGSFLTLPYQLSRAVYGAPQSFLWQPAIGEPDLQVAELKRVYEWQRKQKEDLDEHPIRQFVYVTKEAWRFFVTPWLSVPLVMLLFLLRDAEVALGVGLIACALALSAMYPFFLPHYVAAYTSVIVFLVMRGTIALSSVTVRHFALGRLVAVSLVLGGALTSIPLAPVTSALGLDGPSPEAPGLRQQLSDRLTAEGGRHVVFVRYGPRHSFHDEWVYNAARVDDAAIVWCRSIGLVEDLEAMGYYGDRRAWLAVVDGETVHVFRYAPQGEAGDVAFTLGRM